jgi:phenylalanyl-tRNA synthetase beta chain
MKISYNWLKWYVPELPEAAALADVFTYHLAEVESVEKLADDTVYDINILPNRAHDLLSHMGIAREVSGQLGLAYNDPTPQYKIPASVPTALAIEIATPLCRRYMGRIVRGVKVGPSPDWVVKHLESIGQRSINNIVDATNIVLFDCGQPTHAFDLAKLSAEKITVRMAADGETMTTLDKKNVVTKEIDMVIADGTAVLALAGVKGGTHAEVDDTTTSVMLEVANFDPATVRKTARRLSIFTDAAKRFENDLSPELAPYAMRELSALILEMCPEATFEDVVDVYKKPQEARELFFATEDVNKMLGSNVRAEDIGAIFERYGYSFVREGNGFRLSVPPLRLDLTGPHDMAEEIGRIMGYDAFTPNIPKIDFVPETNEQYARMQAAREKLLAGGYSETMTYTFTKKGAVEVARGAKGKEFLRTNLTDGLKAAYEMNRLNAPLLGVDEIKIFEIGTVFVSAEVQEMRVAYADKKGVTETSLGEFARDLPLSSKAESTPARMTKFTSWSQYPFIVRDIAVWVPADIEGEALVVLCHKYGTELLARAPHIFDQFTKDGKTSLAVRLVFQSAERTLANNDVTPVINTITEAIHTKGWEVR